MSVSASQAKVYKGGGRRYLTLRSACNAEARARIREHCECEWMDHGAMGTECLRCDYHHPVYEERTARIVKRLSNGYMRRFRGES
ncbi:MULTISPECIES: hypothetical protein [Pseudomonas]|uniref:hypothetical protein n=1 Tax=Pseudomonas TaxID=286 RepID=UPI0030017ED3